MHVLLKTYVTVHFFGPIVPSGKFLKRGSGFGHPVRKVKKNFNAFVEKRHLHNSTNASKSCMKSCKDQSFLFGAKLLLKSLKADQTFVP